MPRHKNNPSFDTALLEAEVLKTVVDLFNDMKSYIPRDQNSYCN